MFMYGYITMETHGYKCQDAALGIVCVADRIASCMAKPKKIKDGRLFNCKIYSPELILTIVVH